MANLACEVVTPEKRIFSGGASEVIVPSVDGSCGILPGHEMLACRMQNGVVVVYTDDSHSEKEEFATYMGFTEVSADRVLVLARKAIGVEDIDLPTVKNELSELKAKLEAMPVDALTKQQERVEQIQRDSIADEIEWRETLIEIAEGK